MDTEYLKKMIDKAFEKERREMAKYDLNILAKQVFDWFDEHNLHDPVMQMVKVQEEVGELAHEICRNNWHSEETVDALGDSLVTLLGMCHHLNVDPGYALFTAHEEIKNRKGKTINNSFVKDEDEDNSRNK